MIARAAVVRISRQAGLAAVAVEFVTVCEAGITAEHDANAARAAHRVGVGDRGANNSAAAAVGTVVLRVDAHAQAANIAHSAFCAAASAVVGIG